MKYLEYTPLARIDAFLSTVNLGDSLLKGNLQAYSCKAAGVDKKYSRSLEQEVIDSLVSSPSDFSVSPLGPLSSVASFLWLHFPCNRCNVEYTPLHSCIWEAIDEVIRLEDCDVYSYKPEVEGDPLTERGTIWSFSFFYNRKLRRMLAVDEDSVDDMLSEEEADYLQDMDME